MLYITSKASFESTSIDTEKDLEKTLNLELFLAKDGIYIHDITELAADRIDLEIILDRFIGIPGIPVNKLRHPARLTWFGDHAKFIIANWS